MIILAAVILGLLIGFIRRGKLLGIGKIKRWPLGLIGLVILIFLHYTPYMSSIPFASFLPIVSFLGYLLILITLIFNMDSIFSIMLAVGITANFVVIFINGGYMPVQESIVALMPVENPVTISIIDGLNPVYMIMQQPGTLLWYLGDVLPLPFLRDLTCYTGSVPGLSAGSIFIVIGLIGWIQALMAGARQETNKIDIEKVAKEPKEKKAAATDTMYLDDEEDHPRSAVDEFFAVEQDEDHTAYAPDEGEESDTRVYSTVQLDDESPRYLDDMPDFERQRPDDTGVQDEEDGFFTQSFHSNRNGNAPVSSFSNYYEEDTGQFEPIQTAPLEVVTEDPFKREEPKTVEDMLRDSTVTGNIQPDTVKAPVKAEKSATASQAVVQKAKTAPVPAKEVVQQEDESINHATKEEELEDTIEFGEPKPVLDESDYYAKPTPRKFYDVGSGSGFVVSKAYQEEMAKRDNSQEEMASIWAQVSADQKNLKSSRRRQSRYSTAEANPYLDERKRREAAEMARKEAEEQEKIREQERLLAEQRLHTQRTEEILKTNEPTQDEEDVIMTDEDRIAAGYEKVSFEINGRDVSFWKKKKE